MHINMRKNKVSAAKLFTVERGETPANRRTAGGAVCYKGMIDSANQQRGTLEIANHR